MQSQAKQPTCAERVKSACDSRLSDIREMYDVYCGRQPEHDDITEESWSEYGLSFDYVPPETFKDQDEGYWRYQISYGGPSEEIRFYASPTGKSNLHGGWHLYRAEFWFLDWFDGAPITLRGDQLELARELFEFFDECGSVQAELDKSAE